MCWFCKFEIPFTVVMGTEYLKIEYFLLTEKRMGEI